MDQNLLPAVGTRISAPPLYSPDGARSLREAVDVGEKLYARARRAELAAAEAKEQLKQRDSTISAQHRALYTAMQVPRERRPLKLTPFFLPGATSVGATFEWCTAEGLLARGAVQPGGWTLF